MNWKIRHQGSPRSIEGLTKAQVIEGMQDGLWDPTDEVMGPADGQWSAIENHPELAEIALDLEPPPARVHDDETRLDMNPLIDVALVLLIFFILTTSLAAMQKVLDLPGSSSKNVKAPLRVTKEQVKEIMIKVEARMRDGQKVFRVEDKEVEERYLRVTLADYVKATRKNNLLIDAKGVDIGTVVSIQDAAKGAGFDKVFFPRPQPAPAGDSNRSR